MALCNRQRVLKAKVVNVVLDVAMPGQLEELFHGRLNEIFLAVRQDNRTPRHRFHTQVRVRLALDNTLSEETGTDERISLEHLGCDKLQEIREGFAEQPPFYPFGTHQVAYVGGIILLLVPLINHLLVVIKPHFRDSLKVPYHVVYAIFVEPFKVQVPVVRNS